MCRRSDTLRGNLRYELISDEKGYPRGKTQNEICEAIEVSAFVPWGALSTLSTRSEYEEVFYVFFFGDFIF